MSQPVKVQEIINLEDSDNGDVVGIEEENEEKEETVREAGKNKGAAGRTGAKSNGKDVPPPKDSTHKKPNLKRNVQEISESPQDPPAAEDLTPQPALSVDAPPLSIKRSSSRFTNATTEKSTPSDVRVDLPAKDKDTSSGEKKKGRPDRSVPAVPSGRPARSAALYAAAAMVASKADW